MSESAPTGLIYALSEGLVPDPCPEGDPFQVKIGYTTGGSAESRLAACQTGNPRQLRILAEFSGRPQDEVALHKLLSQYRQAGEWFRLPGFLVDEFLDDALSTAMALWSRLREVGCRAPGAGPEMHDEGQQHLYAWKAIKRAQRQSHFADRLLIELECLDDTGALTEEMLLDGLSTAGLRLDEGIDSVTFLLSAMREEGLA